MRGSAEPSSRFSLSCRSVRIRIVTLSLVNDDLAGLGEMFGAVLFEETPRINPARVRPFVFAVLLLRAAVRASEVTASLCCHAHPDDLRRGDGEASQLDRVVQHTLIDLVQRGVLRDRGDGLYVLSSSSEGCRLAISIAAALDAQLPDHLLQEIGRGPFAGLPLRDAPGQREGRNPSAWKPERSRSAWICR